MTAMVFDGLDGKVYLDENGLTFERSKMRAAGRGVGTVHAVPWSAVRSAVIEKNSLRVDVAGFDRPRASTGDPNAVDLKRGQHESGQAFADMVNTRAAGPTAQPVFATASAPVAPESMRATPAPAASTQPGSWGERFLGFSVFATGVAAIVWALAMLVAVGCLAVLAYIFLTG